MSMSVLSDLHVGFCIVANGQDCMDKRSLSERDICTKFITPALRNAGWDEISQIREEVSFTKGRIIVRGKLVSRGKAKRADYVLSVKPNIPIALIEAKDNALPVGAGMQQGLDYAETLGIPFVFSSNGDGFVFHDRTGMSATPEVLLGLDQFPSPADLWARYRAWKGLTDAQSAVALQDYFDDGSGKAPRYYQINAVNAAIEAIAKGQDRVLLVMATGTGKTYTAFQIIWRLWKAGQKKRILFLADRNVLIDQTMVNDFRPFAGNMAKLSNHRYVMRITGNDKDGLDQLGNFIDPEATYPVIVTTSRLLSTGVDAQTCRLIVLDREVGSMTEFKQIIGRGTRVHEDSQKLYFTVMDFRGSTSHFADPDFDGEPVQIYEPGPDDPITPPDDAPTTGEDGEPLGTEPGNDETVLIDPVDPLGGTTTGQPIRKVYVDGVGARIVAERVEYLDESGKLVTESLRDYTRKALQKQFASLDAFLKRWNSTQRKEAVVEELEAEGLPLDLIAAELGKDLDPFDLICHIAFDARPLTRAERAANVKKRDVFTKFGPQARAVLEALLDKYADEGVMNLDDPGVLKIAPFSGMGSVVELIRAFGGKPGFEQAVRDLQSAIYEESA